MTEEFIAPYFDVRVERRDLILDAMIEAFPTLMAIDPNPPASGPEVELTFGTPVGETRRNEKEVKLEVESFLHRSVLAIRERPTNRVRYL